MGATVFKQPNGLLGRYSYVSDGFTHFNMTPEEYAISKIDDAFRDAEDVQKRHLGQYENIVKDAKGYAKCFDEWIKDSDDEEEKKDLKKQKAEYNKELKDTIESMETDYSNDEEAKAYAEFYKELFDVVNNLAVLYTYEDWKMKVKEYVLVNHPDDMRVMTEKLKEVNELYNKLKDGKKD